MRNAILVCLLPLALGVSPSASGEADLPLLVGTVGPGFTIDLADAQGKHVSILTEGKYQLLIHDLADVHNFVLGSQSNGARLASTEVPFVGDMTFTIDLAPGPYAYACSPHFDVMNGHFIVVPAPPPPDTTKRLSAKVTSKAVSLSATKATAGNYKLTVADRSKARNFHLVGPGVNRRTSKAFTGSVTWRLALETGTYRFGSDPRVSGRLVVRDG
jgi:plastocyanin